VWSRSREISERGDDAGAVAVVIATILGAVELLWKDVAAIAGP